MTVYTVHEPPPRKNEEIGADPDRFVFVRDGFISGRSCSGRCGCSGAGCGWCC